MELVRLDSLAPLGWRDPAVSVGNFDGVHRGHQALVQAAVQEARRTAGTAVVLTFDPHPSRVLSPDRSPSSLMTLAQKAEILEALGADRLAVLPFTLEVSRETAEGFARRILREALGARTVVVGSNFRFGRERSGDLAALERLGESLGFRVQGLDPLVHEGLAISSTRIREALARGAVEATADLLGRPFFIDGKVVAGAGRGRKLGIPTANLDSANETLPGRGVYAGRCRPRELPGEPSWCVINVGRRPTFGGTTTTVEAHLLDFEGDLYGRSLRLEFHLRLREERTFSSVEALAEQIRGDIAQARALLEKAGGTGYSRQP